MLSYILKYSPNSGIYKCVVLRSYAHTNIYIYIHNHIQIYYPNRRTKMLLIRSVACPEQIAMNINF